MPPDNFHIADQFSMLSKLMEIHGENSFRSKAYSIAAFNIEKLPVQLSELPRKKIFELKGIGEGLGNKIIDILDTGELPQLQDMLLKTPPGILRMLSIKGLGPKKISIIWKEMEIESVGELLYACNENRLLLFNGFGEKTQKNVLESVEFFLKSQDSHLYSEAERYALAIDQRLRSGIPGHRFELTGEIKRQLEIVNKIEWVTTAGITELKSFFQADLFSAEAEANDSVIFKASEGFKMQFHTVPDSAFFFHLVTTSSSGELLHACKELPDWDKTLQATSEEDFFKILKLPFVPAYLREDADVLTLSAIPEVLQTKDIRGIIHCHSDWSDGRHSIQELAKACMALKMEYLVISDHSKSAAYANGLQEERIKEQHKYIDELNRKLAPFKIFKSIECDILSDGTMDYNNNVLSTFDLVIASIHSGLKMTEEKATARLIKAIENPYTTILGHITGRLLLSRSGYPVDHKRIIDACASNNVVIELNAHPRRLDMDWRWIRYALDKGVMISIDPDVHYIHRLEDIRYGTLAAQKAGVTKEQNLSSLNLKKFEAFLARRER